MSVSLKLPANVSPMLTVYTVPSTSTWAFSVVPTLKMSISTTVCPPMVTLEPPVGAGGGEPAGETLGEGVGEGGPVGGAEVAAVSSTWKGSRPVNTRMDLALSLGVGDGVTDAGTTATVSVEPLLPAVA